MDETQNGIKQRGIELIACSGKGAIICCAVPDLTNGRLKVEVLVVGVVAGSRMF